MENLWPHRFSSILYGFYFSAARFRKKRSISYYLEGEQLDPGKTKINKNTGHFVINIIEFYVQLPIHEQRLRNFKSKTDALKTEHELRF